MNDIEICQGVDKRSIYNHGSMEIMWTLSYRCNFNCPYCWNMKKNEVTSLEIISKVINFLKYLNQFKDINIILYGGEPTIIPDILDIIKKLKNLYNITLITNTTFNQNFINELNSFNFNKVICCSYHEQLSANKYIDTVKQLVSNKKNNIECRVMIAYHNSNSKNILSLIDELVKIKETNENIIITPKLIYHPEFNIDQAAIDLTKKYNAGEQIELTFDNGEKIITNQTEMLKSCDLCYFKYYKCYCGINNLAIDSNGDLYYCDDYKKSKKRVLLNIATDNYEEKIHDIISKPMICDNETCFCHIYVRKEKILKKSSKPIYDIAHRYKELKYEKRNI